ncbi:hypothetical protein L345_03536, partial [Ophiophagus hannah]
MVWSKRKIQLFKLSLDYGYRDSLQFLEAMPGVIFKFYHQRPFRSLVQLDPGSGVPYHGKAPPWQRKKHNWCNKLQVTCYDVKSLRLGNSCQFSIKLMLTDYLIRADTSRKKR